MQLRVRRNVRRRSAGAVAELGRNDELSFAAFFHAGDALIPALNDLASAELELERFPANARVELCAVGEFAGVMHRDHIAGLRFRAGTDSNVFDLELVAPRTVAGKVLKGLAVLAL